MNENTAIQLFVQALGTMLKETEGVVVEDEGQSYIVFKKDEMIRIIDNEDDVPVGAMVWMHDEPIGHA